MRLLEAGRTGEELERLRRELNESRKAREEVGSLQQQLDDIREAGAASSASSAEQLITVRSELVAVKNAGAAESSSKEEELAAVRLELVAVEEASIKQAQAIRAAGEASSASSTEQLLAVRSELVAVQEASAESVSSKDEELAAVRLELVVAMETGVKQATDLKAKEQAIEDVESKLRAAERRAATAKETAADLLRARDERIVSLERELSFTKKQLAFLTVSKASAVQAALESTSRLAAERDSALETERESTERLRDVEELAKVQGQERAVVELQAQREKEEREKEDAKRSKELDAAHDKMHQLQQAVDAHVLLEQQRTAYHTNQKAGTDALKSKLDALNARASTPVPTSASLRTRSGALRLSGDKVESVVDLQIKNGDLQAEVAELKMRLRNDGPRVGTPLPGPSSSRFDPSRKQSGVDLSRSYRDSSSETKDLADAKEKERLNSVVDSQTKLIQAAQDAGDVWRLVRPVLSLFRLRPC